MLRSSLSLLFASAFAVAGCPVYDDDCADDSGCGPGYVCHLPTRECVSTQRPSDTPERCTRPNDCGAAETCDRFGRCRRESCGDVGCVNGYECVVTNGIEHCAREAGGGQGGAGGEAGAPSQGGAGG